MSTRIVSVIVILLCHPILASADELEGDYLYKVTTIRAATGALQGLLEWEAELGASDYYELAGLEHPLLMRHSQGDQWDLLVIVPMQSWSDFHSPAATQKRADASARLAAPASDSPRKTSRGAWAPSMDSALAATNWWWRTRASRTATCATRRTTVASRGWRRRSVRRSSPGLLGVTGPHDGPGIGLDGCTKLRHRAMETRTDRAARDVERLADPFDG